MPELGHMPPTGAIGFVIVADFEHPPRNADIFIEDGAAHLGVASDIAVVHDHAAVDKGTGVDADAATQDGFTNHAAGKNAAARHDAVDRLTPSPRLHRKQLAGGSG